MALAERPVGPYWISVVRDRRDRAVDMGMEEGMDMSWVFFAAVLVVFGTGAVVLRRRRSQPSRGFPWFWVTFPVAVLALVCTAGAFLSRYFGVNIPKDDIVGLSQPYPKFNQSVQFLSSEQFRVLTGPVDAAFYLWFFPVILVAFTVGSVIAWRRGRV